MPEDVVRRAPTIDDWTDRDGTGHVGLGDVRMHADGSWWLCRQGTVRDAAYARLVLGGLSIAIRRTPSGGYAGRTIGLEIHHIADLLWPDPEWVPDPEAWIPVDVD